MMSLRSSIRWTFVQLETALDKVFGPAWNPLYQLGGLGFLYYWVVVVSGIYVYVLFDTGTTEAYASIQYMTLDQWYFGGVMRSLHRYASDGMVLMMVLHTLREYGLGRFRGPHWFTWVTGTPVAWFVIISGISGYWLVWDELAQYIAIATTEWLDWLGIFGQAIARNFLSENTLDDRFFTLLMFIHIVVPLLLLLVFWIHLQRVRSPRINPNRWLALGTMMMLLGLAFAQPAISHAPANLATVPAVLNLDWYYLAIFPLIENTSAGAGWAFVILMSLVLMSIPWLPPRPRKKAPAIVNLEQCNGCTRCVADCPYNAVVMRPRSDDLPFAEEAVVDPSLCVSCGICAGACPTATPFRQRSALAPGIELGDWPLTALRDKVETAVAGLTGQNRIVLFTCADDPQKTRSHGYASESVAPVAVPCAAGVPPSFVDFILSRGVADGVAFTGCGEGNCHHRFGVKWTKDRFASKRDPYLRRRVPRERIATLWGETSEHTRIAHEITAFQDRLSRLDPVPGKSAKSVTDHNPELEVGENV